MITVAISAGQEVTPLDPPHCRSILAAYSSLHQVASSTLESGLAGGSVLETMDGPDVGDIGRLAPLSLSSSSSSASKTWGTIVGPTLIVFIHLTYSIVQWPYKPAKDVLILPGNGGDCWGLGVRGFLTSPRSGSLMRSALLESKNHGLCIQVSSTQKIGCTYCPNLIVNPCPSSCRILPTPSGLFQAPAVLHLVLRMVFNVETVNTCKHTLGPNFQESKTLSKHSP